MAITSQLLKGTMDGVILKIIENEETYGYKIYMKLQELGFKDFSEGSLYPLLLRLERKNLIIGRKRESDIGPSRKYYILSEEGKDELVEFKTSWDNISNALNNLWSS